MKSSHLITPRTLSDCEFTVGYHCAFTQDSEATSKFWPVVIGTMVSAIVVGAILIAANVG
jgi:hypothetical protein